MGSINKMSIDDIYEEMDEVLYDVQIHQMVIKNRGLIPAAHEAFCQNIAANGLMYAIEDMPIEAQYYDKYIKENSDDFPNVVNNFIRTYIKHHKLEKQLSVLLVNRKQKRIIVGGAIVLILVLLIIFSPRNKEENIPQHWDKAPQTDQIEDWNTWEN